MNARLTQHLVSIIAFAVIVGGCEYAVARESLRHADLHAWEINAKEFQGELPNVSWGPVGNDWLGSTRGCSDGSFEIVLDPNMVTTESEAREVLQHEACHVATWTESEAHGIQWRSCMERLNAVP
jgi:SprT-like family